MLPQKRNYTELNLLLSTVHLALHAMPRALESKSKTSSAYVINRVDSTLEYFYTMQFSYRPIQLHIQQSYDTICVFMFKLILHLIHPTDKIILLCNSNNLLYGI